MQSTSSACESKIGANTAAHEIINKRLPALSSRCVRHVSGRVKSTVVDGGRKETDPDHC